MRKNQKTMKVYKFRSLGDCTAFERVEEILETGEFWCSPLWEQNDPMEGVYTSPDDDDQTLMNFIEKNKYKICCFSSRCALNNPLMWGYYANGFKGVAIEVTVPPNTLDEVEYVEEPPTLQGNVKELLTKKLNRWQDESEHRYLTQSVEPKQKIGEITGLYFGDPYGNVTNKEQVVKTSLPLRRYRMYRDSLIQFAESNGYEHCGDKQIDHGIKLIELAKSQ